MDIIGPLPSARSYRYCLTAVDRISRGPEAWPLQDITAESVAEGLLAYWISRFGIPDCITTDQGRQFESQLFKSMGLCLTTRRSRTTSYHPSSNGVVDRFHRQLKASIMCHPDMSWVEALPLTLLGIHSAFKDDIHASTAELVYGELLKLPGEMLSPVSNTDQPQNVSDFEIRLRNQMSRLCPTAASCHAKPSTFVYKELSTCRHVFLRDDTVRGALQPPYYGPHQVVSRDEKTISVLLHNKTVKVSFDRVKPAYIFTSDSSPTSTFSPTSDTPFETSTSSYTD